MTALPDWMIGEITAEDYETLPEEVCRRIEIVDGFVVVSPSPSRPHQKLVGALWGTLFRQLPPEFDASLDVDLRVQEVPLRNRRPDLVVYQADLPDDAVLRPEHCALVVEIVSPGSVTTDRLHKFMEYAAIGIPHYWRIEFEHVGGVAVHAFELEPATQRYESAGIFHDRLKTSAPFPVDIDLTTLPS